jgi:transcriptional regulator with PAS, ATPase and Fis domain
LRERKGDIPLLSYHFIRRFSQANNKKIEKISEAAMKSLNQYDYPGNVRELMNIINSAVIVESTNELKKKSLPSYFLENIGFGDNEPGEAYLKTLEEVENEHIRRVLKYTGGNKTKAAQILGISRISLISRIKKQQME